ncbi:MAG TPA: hypothetical protein VFE62_00300, partial [Gemmataceae bacterium]|nr:hypothetical protein [Gemmataceae bacterium]
LSVQGMRAGDKLMDKLDPLTRHPDKRVVAEACYFEALLLSLKAAMTKDKKTSQPNLARIETLLRRSVELQPGNQSAWDILMAAVSAQEKKDKELIELCEARLRARDDARNRFFVAKVFEEMNRYADAEKHLRAGIKCNESSTFNHVGLAAVLLRSNDPKRRPEALEHLEKAEELLAKNEYAALSDDVSVLRAVNTALTGDPALARVMLESVLGRDEKHDMAGKMLKVLDR